MLGSEMGLINIDQSCKSVELYQDQHFPRRFASQRRDRL